MKPFTLLSLVLATVATAAAQSPETTLPTLKSSYTRRIPLGMSFGEGDVLALKLAAPTDGTKKGQIWVGFGSLSYEKFSGDTAGDEFGFSPTNGLGYQRNFYPGGRLTNGVGYSLGIGFVAAGAAVFYHQGSARNTDFRIGVAADIVYSSNISYFDSNFVIVPFAVWGIKI